MQYAENSRNYRFGGHQSFALRIAWLPKAVRAIERGSDPFSDPMRGLVELGVGKNMVEALRCWVEAYGIATRAEAGWALTDEANSVLGAEGFDPFLEDPRTLWWLHWRITTGQSGRFFAWELLLNRWNEPTFTASQVVAAFAAEAARDGRQLSDVSLRQHFDVWLRTYHIPRGARVVEDSLDSPLAALGLIRFVGEQEGQGRKEPVYAFDMGLKRTVPQALFRYCLCEWWESRPGMEETVPFADVVGSPSSPGRVLRMPEREVRSRLLSLSSDPRFEFELIESLNQYQLKRRHQFPSKMERLCSIFADLSVSDRVDDHA